MSNNNDNPFIDNTSDPFPPVINRNKPSISRAIDKIAFNALVEIFEKCKWHSSDYARDVCIIVEKALEDRQKLINKLALQNKEEKKLKIGEPNPLTKLKGIFEDNMTDEEFHQKLP